MQNHAPTPRRDADGFSLVEMLIVVAVVAVMAAVALPNIAGYLRNYKVRGAAQDVSGEMQASRSKAIMSNTNTGVFFVAADADSYRWIMTDNPAGEELGPLRDLPGGIVFVPSTGADSGATIRFNRLGGFCNPEASASCPAIPTSIPLCTSAELSRCDNGAGDAYIEQDAGTGGGMTVRLLDQTTDLQRTVRIAPGGRILPQP